MGLDMTADGAFSQFATTPTDYLRHIGSEPNAMRTTPTTIKAAGTHQRASPAAMDANPNTSATSDVSILASHANRLPNLSPIRYHNRFVKYTARVLDDEQSRGLVVGDVPTVARRPVDRHDGRDDSVDLLPALVLGRLHVAGGVLLNGDVIGHPA